MRSTLDELTKEILEVRNLVASIGAVHQALSVHEDQATRLYPLVRRRFDYAALVVALYASFEKFAEDLVLSYARLVTRSSSYESLPETLKKKHLTRSADLLTHGRLGEGRYAGVREVDVVRNLYDCLSGAESYALNEHAIVGHDVNLRYTELGSLFASVGIEHLCDRARRADALVGWYQGLAEGGAVAELHATIVQGRLDDLVERRNRVTHRGGSPSELIGPQEMTELVNFVEALAASVFALTVGGYLKKKYSGATGVEHLRLLQGPLKPDRNVVVVAKPAKRLFVGQPIFALVDAAGARWGRIRELRLEDASTTAVEQSSSAAAIGVAVDFRCPKGVVLTVLDTDDDVVWSPDAARLETEDP